LSRHLGWDAANQILDSLRISYPLRKLTGPFEEQLTIPFSIFHFALGLLGCALILSKPRLANLGFLNFEPTKHARFNLLIISSFLSIYVFGLYNLPELLIGLRVPIFKQSTLFDYLTSVNFLISGFLFLHILRYILKDDHNQYKIGFIIFFTLLAITCILIAGEVISWGQRLFDWEIPGQLSILKKPAEADDFHLLPRLLIIEWAAGVIFSILLIEGWLGKTDSLQGKLTMIIPPWELYISAIIAISSSGNINPNIFEVLLSLFFLMYSIWIWNTWRMNIDSTKPTTASSM
jgi:hypothetical protein